MLIVDKNAMDRFLEIMKFAAENDFLGALVDKLEYLNNYSNHQGGAYPINEGKNTSVRLGLDPAYMSMSIEISCCEAWFKDPDLMQSNGLPWQYWMSGALIFDGPSDPTKIDPLKHGWSVHT